MRTVNTKRFLVQDTDSQLTMGDGHVIQAKDVRTARLIHNEHYGCHIFKIRELEPFEFAGTKGMVFDI